MPRQNFTKTKVKIKGRQLREIQEKLAVINYTIEKALTDCFVRQEIFELLDAARDAGQDLERLLL